ncbi:MAG: hypothetical protein QXL01_02845 [Thermoplasmatales archaeon]
MSDVMEALKKTLSDIEDIMAKSANLAKAEDKKEDEKEDKKEDEKEDKMEKAEDDELKEEFPESALPSEKPTPSIESEPAQSEQPSQEDEMSQEESAEQHASSLSDEELDMMLQVLMAEKEKRSSSQSSESQPETESHQSDEQKLEMSMKDDYAKMHKSMESLTQIVSDLKNEIIGLKTGKVEKPASQSKITSKAAASNLKDVQVLEKSAPVAKRLSKSETLNFLQGQIRKRNPLVNSMLIAEVNLATEEEIPAIQDRLALEGLEFPKK